MRDPLDDLVTLGSLPLPDAVARLHEMGDEEVAARLGSTATADTPETFRRLPWSDAPPYAHTAHAFGFVSAGRAGDRVDVVQAGTIEADDTLRGARVNVTLDELRIADYPGRGRHDILFDFAAQNQVAGDRVEHVHFNQVYRGIEGGSVGVSGYPVFVGLTVGSEGLAFRCATVNVKNEDDEALLEMLDADVFRAGLQLVSTLQPAIAPLAGMAVGLTRTLATRHRNVAVQSFSLGLDFSTRTGGARLAEGLYVAVQIPERDKLVWSWDQWTYDRRAGRIVNRQEPETLIPYNYLAFGVARHHG